MPRVAKKSSRPRRRVARKGKKARSSNVSESASLSCKRSLVPSAGGPDFLTNALYSVMDTQLSDFPRAVQVAAAYQNYRIKQIAITFKPTYDTFQGNAGGASMSKMNMYYMLDKSGAIPTNVSLEGLRQMGARPRQLDEKNMVVKWAPSVLLDTATNAAGGLSLPNQYKISPWLTTSDRVISPGAFIASSVDHLGLYWYCDQLITGGSAQPYQIELEVQFQFKKPLSGLLTASKSAIAATHATLNDSPDGIVGGGDGI